MKSILVKSMIAASMLFSVQAFAYSECQVSIDKTYTGQGSFWIIGAGNVSGYFQLAAPDGKPMMATALLSKAQGRPIVIRFNADGVNCSNFMGRGDVIGIWAL